MPVAATDSFKWAVRAVSDGAGGLVVAWEENRETKVCCRDIRDIYAQRIGPDGQRAWAPEDVAVARAGEGEEIEALWTRSGGGAWLIWRRGLGVVMGQILELDGTLRWTDADPPGRALRIGDGKSAWAPPWGAAADPASEERALLWGERIAGHTGLWAMPFGRDHPGLPQRFLFSGGDVYPAALARAGARWLAVLWTVVRGSVELVVQPLAPDGTAAGSPAEVGSDPERTWAQAFAAPASDGAVWVLWSALHPERPSRSHSLRLLRITESQGRLFAASAVLGEARTQAMYISAASVGVEGGEPRQATDATVAWRPTSALAAAGESGVVLWTDGDRVLVAAAAPAEGGMRVGEPADLAPTVSLAFTPALAPAPGGAVAMWAEPDGNGGTRLVARRLRVNGASVMPAGEPVQLAATGAKVSPRLGEVVETGDGTAFVWTEIGPGERGRVLAQKVAWDR